MKATTFDACLQVGRSFGFEEAHSLQDARLAVRLFDLTTDLHQLDPANRDLLQCAALLHDIGYVQGYEEHHKTAYDLIMKASLPGLTEREQRIIANVARYHRGARPKLDHPGFAALSEQDRTIATGLGAILRLADGLDRTHTDSVHGLDVQMASGALVVLVDCPFGCPSEVWAGEKKGRLFGGVFGVQVSVRPLQAAAVTPGGGSPA